MKAAAFEYARASGVDEAIALLVQHGARAKLLAGGQSLLPALNLRLMTPELLIDVSSIDTLRGIQLDSGVIRIGALTRHADLLASPKIAEHAPLLRDAIAHVAHPAIRNRGTVGGNLAHADPASELPACMLALDAAMVIHGRSGERRIPAAEFFLGLYQTALAPDEMLTAIELPAIRPGQRSYFQEYARRRGDYAIIGLAAHAAISGDAFDTIRLAFFGVGDRATLCPAAEQILQQNFSPAVLAAAQSALSQDLQPQNDHQASAATRLHLARTLLSRGVHALLGRSAIPEERSA